MSPNWLVVDITIVNIKLFKVSSFPVTSMLVKPNRNSKFIKNKLMNTIDKKYPPNIPE